MTMRMTVPVMTVFCLLATVWFSPSLASELQVITEISGEAQFRCENDQVCGHNVELVREIMNRLGVSYPITILPWARAINELDTKDNVALFGTARTPQREKRYEWVGPLVVIKYLLLARVDTTISINALEDAKTVDSFGCCKGDVREEILRKKGFTNLEPIFGDDANGGNMLKLLHGRLTLLATSSVEWPFFAEEQGIAREEFKEEFTFEKIYAYIAFSSGVPDSAIEQWQAALDQIKADGTYARIFSQYASGPLLMTYDKKAPAM